VSAPSEAGLARPGARAINRAEIVHRNFLDFLAGESPPAPPPPDPDQPLRAGSALTGKALLDYFRFQIQSRQLDLVAREMRARNEGFYTIGSSGHEGNAALGMLSRPDDPAFLHYRSGAFMMARGASDASRDPVYDAALSLAASAEDPISGGRHKVWGNRPLWVLPQTSTIASHLPKAVGAAIALEQTRRLGLTPPVPDDAVVICSFGDASANHSAATGAFNAAQWTAFQRLPAPILFVCEDNGLGISVRTPEGWIEASFSGRQGLDYFAGSGIDPVECFDVTRDALDHCRRSRRPTFLHLKVRRLLGHAGTDVETEYLSLAEVENNEARDPLLATARTVLAAGLLDKAGIRALYEQVGDEVRGAAARAAGRPKLTTREAVMAPLAIRDPGAAHAEAGRTVDATARIAAFGGENRLPEQAAPRHLSLQINRALKDLMVKYPEMTLFGEDVAQKGGVYTVTSGLAAAFRGNRVFNTLLDETTILGMAQGHAAMGLLPFPEIQYLAYFHNACDQIRGEAASLQFFSNRQFASPMVMRIASLGYQKGFGGHFHNDNSFTALRDIPGLVIACPSRGDDAAGMLRTCAALARTEGKVVAFLEPIALYMAKDLYEPRDGAWQFPYPEPGVYVPFGSPRRYGDADADLLIVTYGNGVPMSLRAARRIENDTGARVTVLDLRWLKPLNRARIAAAARRARRILIVDEGRRTGGLAEELFTLLDEEIGPGLIKARVTGADSYIPLADAANLVLLSEDEIVTAATRLTEQEPRR
jgi:2-oxoisovalerate dehydrogenase E1 component